MKKYAFLLLLFLGILVVACKGVAVQDQNDKKFVESVEIAPVEGAYEGFGWGTIYLIKNQTGVSGTYTDTWNGKNGVIKLWKEEGKWKGNWSEPLIKRGGSLYKIQILDKGRTIKGFYDMSGSKNSFKDKPFIWKHK